MTRFKPLILSLVFLITIAAIGSFYSFPFIIYNHTRSLPLGFYFLAQNSIYSDGDIAVFPIPSSVEKLVHSRHWGPDNSLMMKPIIAHSGDFVCTDNGRFVVNDVDFGVIDATDSKGLDLPRFQFCAFVQPGYFFVGVHKPHSFDSRYFGPIADIDVLGAARPFWLTE